MSSENARIRCSVQRALLGCVTPNLRAVYVTYAPPRSVKTVFYYDQPPSEDEEELASFADTEMLADFTRFDTEFEIKTVAAPTRIVDGGSCLYKRYEPVGSSMNVFSDSEQVRNHLSLALES